MSGRYCAILPSPEKLAKGSSVSEQDETNTRNDFNLVWKWLTGVFGTGFYVDMKRTIDKGEQLENVLYNTLITLAFNQAFAPIRHTNDPAKQEIVLLYYAGHGLSPQKAKLGGWPSSPSLEKVNFNAKDHFESAQPFFDEIRSVKGGELCLHDVGFCDLQGLLTPFVAALKEESMNARGEVKKNKHLVVIADSCYSGVLAQELQQLMQRDGPWPWRENGCSVTVQSACSEDEMTFGGYFTPCFVHFNQLENQHLIEQLKEEWSKKTEIEKDVYRELDLPSPCVETTMSPEQLNLEDEDPIMSHPFPDFRLILFHEPGFFKYCYLRFSEVITCEASPENKPRVLPEVEANGFLNQAEFDIIDYKLKKMRNRTPIGLFLVEYHPKKRDRVVCAHIHFKSRANTDVANVSTVTLVEHKRPKDPSALYPEIRITKRTGIRNNIESLVAECKSYVDKKENGRWEDLGRWNMKNGDLGVNNKFRLKERSGWMDKYVEKFVPKNTE